MGGDWTFNWRRRFFVWEEELLNNLLEVLNGNVRTEGIDRWAWRLEEGGVFFVKSAYKKLVSMESQTVTMGEEEKKVFGQVWKSLAPSKVVAFSWKVLLNRIPMCLNLSRRRCSGCLAELCALWFGGGIGEQPVSSLWCGF